MPARKAVIETTETKSTEVVTPEKSVVEEKPKDKTFDKEELIDCMSICNGGLTIVGDKSGNVYTWADYGDVEPVEYQDLLFLTRSKKPCVFTPRFIIEDEDFIAQHPELSKLYDSMYSTSDITDILDLPVRQMKQAIEQLPKGALESLKGIAGSMIDAGKLDSIEKIKTLDGIFGTNLLLTLVHN